jgi:anti-anti-sigma regulatory factor
MGELRAALLPLSACRPTLLTLDLGMLTHYSCLAIGVLAEFCRGVTRNGGRVRLAGPLPQAVDEALSGTELLDLFARLASAECCRAASAGAARNSFAHHETKEVQS